MDATSLPKASLSTQQFLSPHTSGSKTIVSLHQRIGLASVERPEFWGYNLSPEGGQRSTGIHARIFRICHLRARSRDLQTASSGNIRLQLHRLVLIGYAGKQGKPP